MSSTIHDLQEPNHTPAGRATKLFTAPLPSQRDLYQSHDSKLRECLREDIDAWARERYPGLDARTMYAEAMSVACEEHVSRSQVNNWCANEGNQFPLNKVKGHLLVTGRHRLLTIAVDGTLFGISDRTDSLFAKRGRLAAELQELNHKLALVDLEIKESR